MKKVFSYFLPILTITSLLFFVSCSEEEDPIGDLIISLTPSDEVSAAPGETITIEVDVTGGDADTQIQALSDNGGSFVPTNGIITAGESIQFVVPTDATIDDVYTLTFSIQGSNVSEQLTVNIAYASVADVIAGNSELSTLNEAVVAAGLEDALMDANATYTVFAPSNAALDGVDLTGYTTEELASLLQYHVIADSLMAGDLETGYYPTLNQDSVYIVVDGTTVTINNVTVTTPDLAAGNGVVHIVDGIITSDVTTYEAFLLAAPTGDQTSETFFSTTTGELYSYDEVTSTSENISQWIDFGYYYGATAGGTIASPDSWPADAVLYSGLAAWSTRNNTDFRSTNLTVADFDAIAVGQGDDIEAEFEAGTDFANTGRANPVAEEDIIAFTTADGRFGLIKVLEIVGTTGSNDGIRIEVKVTN